MLTITFWRGGAAGVGDGERGDYLAGDIAGEGPGDDQVSRRRLAWTQEVERFDS